MNDNYVGFSQKRINNHFLKACSEGNMSVVELLANPTDLPYRARLNYCNNEPLMQACKNGHLEVVKFLLSARHGGRHDKACIYGKDNTSLMWACHNGHLEIVKFLLSHHQSQNWSDIESSFTEGFRWACHNGHHQVAKHLACSPDLKFHADISMEQDWCLRHACKNGHLQVVKLLLSDKDIVHHAHLNGQDGQPLSWACEGGHLDIVEFLLSDEGVFHRHGHWANIHAHDNEALHLACRHDQVGVVGLLLNTMNERSPWEDFVLMQEEALMHAYAYDAGQTMDYLIFEAGIELNQRLKKEIENKPPLIAKFNERHANQLQELLPVAKVSLGKTKL